MSTGTGIQWTEATWNPVTGCTRVSAGCDHCYAVKQTHRLEKMGQSKYAGLTVLNKSGERHFNGKVRCHEDALTIPLRWAKPRRIFVNSMSDLFHKGVPFEFIDRVFAVMALCPRHTFQVLTKRPDRMAAYLADPAVNAQNGRLWDAVGDMNGRLPRVDTRLWHGTGPAWPLPNVWLGTSVENQEAADERIPYLLRCPAAVRFLSAEPLLGPVNPWDSIREMRDRDQEPDPGGDGRFIHWIIVGGESGPGARPCELPWIRGLVAECQLAHVPVFVKQLGAAPTVLCGQCGRTIGRGIRGGFVDACGPTHAALIAELMLVRHSKGGDSAEWPPDLCVREYPSTPPRGGEEGP